MAKEKSRAWHYANMRREADEADAWVERSREKRRKAKAKAAKKKAPARKAGKKGKRKSASKAVANSGDTP